MRINCVKVSNFRNIDGVVVAFNPNCNYIIGENNLGKSNFLSLLTIVCNGKGFDEKDFADTEKPIDIEMEIQLSSSEQGFFGDNFSPDDASMLKIRYYQTIKDAYPTIVSLDSNESIPSKSIRKINFLKYETTSIPNKELRIDSQKGVGLLISGMIDRFVTDDTIAFLNEEHVSGATSFINERLNKIRSFRDHSIIATATPNPADVIKSLLYLSDGDRKIDAAGHGVQYMTMASINILCQIMELYKSKSISFEERLYNDDGKKILPLILAIDEPEVHLHPFLQRSLIGYYKKVLQNEDAAFVELLKDCFGIDGISGQLIIVTHSTDALVGDYRNLIRFYRYDDKIVTVSGYNLRPNTEAGASNEGRITAGDEKHLIMRFPEIKEAFYAKCAILFEGETEFGCIYAFADKLGIPLDDYGICAINAKGEKSIKPLRNLLALFGVPSIAVYDGDVQEDDSVSDDEFYTTEPCFEVEIVKTLFDNGKATLVREIALELDSNAPFCNLDQNYVRKEFEKIGADISSFTPKSLSEADANNRDEFCSMYSAWFMKKKGILLGRIIGEKLTADLIPDCYADAIKKAQEVAVNA